MRARSRFALSCLLAFASQGAAHQLFAQANVVENEPVTLYVDAANGVDSNPGTQPKPYQTISAAVKKALWENQQGVGTKILIASGTYREVIDIGYRWKQTKAPITLEAIVPWGVRVSGADTYSDWAQDSTPGVYVHSWTPIGSSNVPGGWPSSVAKIVYRREMLFINSSYYTQVTDKNWMVPGTFFVDDQANLIYVYPRVGTNLAATDVEVARRVNLLTINHRSNVVLRGMIFQYGISNVNASTVNVFGSDNILIDNIRTDWNSWGGLGLHQSTHMTVQNSFANHNGGEGFNAFRNVGLAFNGNESDFNGWRSAQAGFYDFGMGGTKFFNEHLTTIEGFRAFNNYAQGLWFDTDNRDITVDHAVIGGSFNANVQVELNAGPISISNSYLCSGGTGINLVNSSNLTVTNTGFYDNSGTGKAQAEVYIAGLAGGRHFTDWETGAYHNVISSNLIFLNNTILDPNPGQLLFSSYFTGYDWTEFQTTLHSDQNQWFDQAKTTTFVQGGKSKSLTGWQALTSQDAHSGWTADTAVAQACVLPKPGYFDYQIFSNAPYAGGSYGMTKGAVTLAMQAYEYQPVTAQPGTQALPTDFSFQVVGLPAGVTATYSPMTQNPRGLAFSIGLNASHSAVDETVFVTIIATSKGLVRTLTVPVHIIPA